MARERIYEGILLLVWIFSITIFLFIDVQKTFIPTLYYYLRKPFTTHKMNGFYEPQSTLTG